MLLAESFRKSRILYIIDGRPNVIVTWRGQALSGFNDMGIGSNFCRPLAYIINIHPASEKLPTSRVIIRLALYNQVNIKHNSVFENGLF